MTTKTDHHAIMELKKAYIPAKRGVVNVAEEKLIREVLELSSRNDIELQNIRDNISQQRVTVCDLHCMISINGEGGKPPAP